jgi:hypothetical protein
MKIATILFATLSMLLLGGCHHASGQLSTKNLSIGVSSKSSPSRSASGPRHCPPGHAKKGQC